MFKFSWGKLKNNINNLRFRLEGITEESLAETGKEVLDRCFNESPTVPRDTGRLRNSGSLHVNSKLIMTTNGLDPGESGTPDTIEGIERSGGMKAFIKFNTEYALYVHENPMYNFKYPGSGAFYLSMKIEKIDKVAFSRHFRPRFIGAVTGRRGLREEF